MGAERGASLGGLQQSQVRREGQLLLAVCLETGEVEWMELEGNSNAGTSETFLRQLRERHLGPLNVIWDNALAHRDPAMRSYLETPGLDTCGW